MKTFIIGLAIMGVSLVANAADGTKKSCFNVSGMTCAACGITLKSAVKKLKGISTIDASVENKNASVTYNPDLTSESEIKKTIDSVGYEATPKSCEATKS